MKRATVSAFLGLALVGGLAAGALAQSSTSHLPAERTGGADHSKLPYEVRIVPTTMKGSGSSVEIGADSWIARGYDLKSLIAQIYDIDARRIDFPAGETANARYDVTLTASQAVDADAMQRLLEDALEKKCRLSIKPESRSQDVYVLTAPNGPGVAMHRHAASQHSSGKAALMALELGGGPAQETEDEEQITIMQRNCSGVPSGGGIKATAGTLPDLGRTLEQDLDRLLIDETHLTGSYDFQVGSYDNKESLFKLMREQLGIVVTPAQRKVTVLTVRSGAAGQSMQAAL
jgi:uncharacterized protein (TIGR03435 family)